MQVHQRFRQAGLTFEQPYWSKLWTPFWNHVTKFLMHHLLSHLSLLRSTTKQRYQEVLPRLSCVALKKIHFTQAFQSDVVKTFTVYRKVSHGTGVTLLAWLISVSSEFLLSRTHNVYQYPSLREKYPNIFHWINSGADFQFQKKTLVSLLFPTETLKLPRK